MSGAILSGSDFAGKKHVEELADVVIIGTGAAGATAARVLSEAGLDVVLLEEGAALSTEQFRNDAWSAFKNLWRDAGFQVARGRAMIPVLQGRAVGGTTVINGAIVHRLPEPIHASWKRQGHIDQTLSYEALVRAWESIEKELSIAPTPDSVLGGNNAMMKAGLHALGWKGNPILRNVHDCQGSGRCLQGCPTGRKQSMQLTYVPYAVERGARVFSTCTATEVLHRGKRAVGVRGRFIDPWTGAKGATVTVHARRAVIVAASAIQTPILLRASGLRHPLLGQRFQAHPGTSVLGVFDAPVQPWFGATQGFESTHYWDERMKFEAVGVPFEIGAARVPGIGQAFAQRIERWGHLAQWGVQVRAEAMGRVRAGLLGGASITYDLTNADVRRYKLGVERLVQMMFAAGAKAVHPGVHGLPETIFRAEEARAIHQLSDDPGRFHFIAAHLFGTAVMHPDARQGAVSAQGESHEVRGLYVVDSSVFPTNLGVNPQHAICGIAWLLAERLAEQSRAR